MILAFLKNWAAIFIQLVDESVFSMINLFVDVKVARFV